MIIINKINIDEKEMCDTYQNGVTTKELAERYNCHYCTILKRLHKCGIETIYLPILPMDKISKDYQNGISVKKLAKRYNCSVSVISKRLHDLGIHIRSYFEANQNMRIILPKEKICEEYQDGMSLSKLAKKYDCSIGVIERYIKENNTEIRSRLESTTTKLPVEDICKKYQTGISSVKLAEEYDCDRSTILNHLHKSGIKVKSVVEANVGQSYEARRKSSATKQGISYDDWTGFSEQRKYCTLFNLSLKKTIRLYFDHKCFIDHESEDNGRALNVHHVGYDKRCGCDATQFCIFVPVKAKWNSRFNGSREKNRWYWYTFLMIKIFTEHPNYFGYHIPVWGMSELEYNYNYVFEKFRR